jgi:hypothetical protein
VNTGAATVVVVVAQVRVTGGLLDLVNRGEN